MHFDLKAFVQMFDHKQAQATQKYIINYGCATLTNIGLRNRGKS